MAYEIVMPRLGWTMEEGLFVEWLKKDGDTVKAGDLLCAVEGDKAINEIESFEAGLLRIPPDAPLPGAKVKVGGLLGYILSPGEAAPFASQGNPPAEATKASAPSAATPAAEAAAPATHPGGNAQRTEPTISPRARRIASELGVAWLSVKGSGRTGRIVERDVRAAAQMATRAPGVAAQSSGELRTSPLARRRAGELNVVLQALAAVQPGIRLEVADVEAAAARRSRRLDVADVPADAAALSTPMSGVRKLIAERMGSSAHTTAAVTLTTEVDATELVRIRKEIAADLAGGRPQVVRAAMQQTGDSLLAGAAIPAPSYNDLLARLLAVALQEFPALNASLHADGIVQHTAVHIGMAVDTERGLLVPVVRDVHKKSVQAIAAESALLSANARAGKISADDLRGGTFTISNLGMYEIDAFTPIINLPECAILGVGRIVAKQVVVDEESETVAVRKLMTLSLTFDHRLVDGGPAARFLQRVKRFVEHPYLWLTR